MKPLVKHLLSLLLLLFMLTETSYTQPPPAIRMQGVLRDQQGQPVEGTVSVRVSIYTGAPNGTRLYRELFSAITDEFGLFNVNVGTGVVDSGTFGAIDWKSGDKFLKLEVDTSGGSDYIDMGTTQMLSVPYALFAGSSDSSSDNKWNAAGLNIYNNNTGNVGIGTPAPSGKFSVKGNVSIGDSGAALSAPPNGMRVEGPIHVGNGVITTSDGGFIVIDDGRLRRHTIGVNYVGDYDSAETNTGLRMNIAASDSVSGSSMNLSGSSDSAVVIGSTMNGTGSGYKFIGTAVRVLDSDPNSGNVYRIASGTEIQLSASDSVNGSQMKLAGGSDTAIIIGEKVAYGGSGKEIIGFEMIPYSPIDSFPYTSITGTDFVLGASQSVNGHKIIVIGRGDTAQVTGMTVIPQGKGDKFVAFKSDPYAEDGRRDLPTQKVAMGSDFHLYATDSVIGSNHILNGGSDSAIVIGNNIIGTGSGKTFNGTSVYAKPYNPVSTAIWFASVIGSEMNLAASDSVIGSDIQLNNNSDSTKVIGLRIKVGPNAASGDLSKSWCFGVKVKDDASRGKSTGVDITLNATDSVTGQKISLSGASDSTEASGVSVSSNGTGKRFTAFAFNPQPEPPALPGSSWYVGLGSYLNVTGSDSAIGSDIILNNGSDTTKMIGLRINAGPNAAFGGGTRKWCLGIQVRDDNDREKSTAVQLAITASDSATGTRQLISGTGPNSAVIGDETNSGGQGQTFIGHLTRVRGSYGDGFGDACDNDQCNLRDFTGSKISISPVQENAKGVMVDFHGNSWGSGSKALGFGVHIQPIAVDSARGIQVINEGQNVNVGGDFEVSGGTNNIGLRSMSTGSGTAAHFSGSGGASGLLVSSGNVGIGNTLPSSLLGVGQNNQFQVDLSGDIRRINNIPYSFPANQGNSGQTLQNDGSGNLSWSDLQGDVSGSLNSATVVKIQNVPVTNVPPTTGQIFKFNGTSWGCAEDSINSAPTGPAGGDLSGTYPNPSVVKIQGTAVSIAVPTDGQVLTYNASTFSYQPENPFAPRISYEAGVQPASTPILSNVLTTVIYGNPSFNDGMAYDPTTGIFTVPSTGKYHFDASVLWLALAAGNRADMAITVNGTVKKNTYNTFNFTQDFPQSLSIDLALTAGDQVKVIVSQNSGVVKNLLGGNTVSTFSGHQLY